MDAWLLGTLLGLLIALNVALVLRLEMCHKSLIFALKSSVLDLNSNEVEIPDQLITDVKTELVETVQDLIGQMRVPEFGYSVITNRGVHAIFAGTPS